MPIANDKRRRPERTEAIRILKPVMSNIPKRVSATVAAHANEPGPVEAAKGGERGQSSLLTQFGVEGSAQERSAKGQAGQRSARPNDGELEMDSEAVRNGLMDTCLQSSSPIITARLCQKRGLTPFSSFKLQGEPLLKPVMKVISEDQPEHSHRGICASRP